MTLLMVLLLQIISSFATSDEKSHQTEAYVHVSYFQKCKSHLDCYGLDYCACCSLKAMSSSKDKEDKYLCCSVFNTILGTYTSGTIDYDRIGNLRESLDTCAKFEVDNIRDHKPVQTSSCSWPWCFLLVAIVIIITCMTTVKATNNYKRNKEKYECYCCCGIVLIIIAACLFYL